MSILRVNLLLLATALLTQGQGQASSAPAAQLPEHATVPIAFTQSVTAAKAKAGDTVQAKTMQAIQLVDGRVVKAGARVTGHVLTASAFRYNKMHYAKQVAGTLVIQIDSLEDHETQIPLRVTLRAMANPAAVWDATKPQPSDMDPDHTTVQIGGDLLTPSQDEIRDRNGDVVGYNKKGGAYAHLLANTNGMLTCDPGDTEQPVSLFSASACGLYGFGDVALSSSAPSGIVLSSTHSSPEISKNSIALLETVVTQ